MQAASVVRARDWTPGHVGVDAIVASHPDEVLLLGLPAERLLWVVEEHQHVPSSAVHVLRWRLGDVDALPETNLYPVSRTTLTFVKHVLGIPDVTTVSVSRSSPHALMLARVVPDLAAEHGALVVGGNPDAPPHFTSRRFPSGLEEVPASWTAVFPAGTAAPVGVALRVRETDDGLVVTSAGAPTDVNALRDLRQELDDRATAADPFTGHVLKVALGSRCGTVFSMDEVDLADAGRHLSFSEDLLGDLTDEVRAFHANNETLLRRGLGGGRGILLAGKPGTGKTELVRALAGRFAGDFTVLLPEPTVIGTALDGLYADAVRHAPSIVVLDDIDLNVGHRSSRAGELRHFLAALDGAASGDAPILTLATTNDVAGLDKALTRTSRFDRIIEDGAPDEAIRRSILTSFLDDLVVQVDIDVIAAATDGHTGSDLQEHVRTALMRHGESVTTQDVLDAITRREAAQQLRTGVYL